LLRDELRKLRGGTGTVESYRKAKASYKKETKTAKERQALKVEEELDQVKTVADGWSFIKRLTKSRSTTTQIPGLPNHFRQLLQGEPQQPTLPSLPTVSAPELTQKEFLVTLAQMKERKAEGPDGLKAEAIIYADHNTKQEIRRQINEILQGGEIPAEWGESTIWPIYKKGDPSVPSNYRGIAIGNAIHKLLANVVRSRLQALAEELELLPDPQNGFRKNRSTVDSLFIMNACIQTTIAQPKGRLFAFFIDFKTAFDSVNRDVLWETLQKLNIPHYLLVTLKNMYRDVHYRVDCVKFQSHIGLKQGCPLSPLLFALYIQGLDASLQRNQLGGVVLGRKKIYYLAFADDIVLLATNENELKDMIRAVHRFANNRRLSINEGKSKVMMFSKGGRRSQVVNWTVDGREYEEVEEFKYLGVTLQRNGRFTRHHRYTARELKRRSSEVWSIGERLYKNNFIVRAQMFNSLVAPIALYAAEVTGFDCSDDYDVSRRRYMKWVLGLPQGTKSTIVDMESGGGCLRGVAFSRALKYEKGIGSKKSQLLKEAHTLLLKEETHWRTAREQRAREFGWTADALKEESQGDILQKVLAWESLHLRKRARRIPWYQPPKGRTPEYLLKRNPQMRMLARYRTGAAFRGNHHWSADNARQCRVCGAFEESPEHLATHDHLGRNILELLEESGKGASWMELMEYYNN
jgi:hypothetical protein